MKYGVGIDVSKGKSTVSILSIEGEVIEMPFDINHDVEDLEKLDTKLQELSKEDLKIVLEQTGTYHLPIVKVNIKMHNLAKIFMYNFVHY